MNFEPCPDSPNCISSQADPDDATHFLPAVKFSAAPADVIAEVAKAIEGSSGAQITDRSESQVTAVFTTRFFRFKDDVTFAVDPESNELHFRSASRVGHSDLGANKKRIEALLARIRPVLN